MARKKVPLPIMLAEFLNATAPTRAKAGTSPGWTLKYDAATDEAAFWQLNVPDDFSTDPQFELQWYGDTATSGNVVWGAALSCITPETDTQDVETDALDTETTVTDGHLGTTAQRLMRATIDVGAGNEDSMAGGDSMRVRIRRLGSNGSDTMAGDAQLEHVYFTYDDGT